MSACISLDILQEWLASLVWKWSLWSEENEAWESREWGHEHSLRVAISTYNTGASQKN